MGSMADETNEFDEFDVTEQEFDQMYAEAQPVVADLVPQYYARQVAGTGYYKLTTVRQGPAPAASGPAQWVLEQPTRPSAVPSAA